MASPFYAYAPDIYQGGSVVQGQLLGYVGDSGNAENTVSHLHFEITAPDGSKINPYAYLREAKRIGAPNVYPPVRNELLPYGPSINTLPSIETGRFTDTTTNQILVGTGVGYAPHIRVISPNGTEQAGFYAYKPDFTGGINVAAGDVDGDGKDEIITGTMSGAPHVRVLKLDGTEIAGFYAYSPSFTGGVNVAAADVDGDGKDEIITGTMAGAPHVRVLKPDGTEIGGFYAYASSFEGGVDVAGGDVAGDAKDEIITSPGPGGGAQIRILTADGSVAGATFNAYPGSTGGARVSVGNTVTASAKQEILTMPWAGGSPTLRTFDANGSQLAEKVLFDSWWRGSYNMTARYGASYVAAGGNRRASIMAGQ